MLANAWEAWIAWRNGDHAVWDVDINNLPSNQPILIDLFGDCELKMREISMREEEK